LAHFRFDPAFAQIDYVKNIRARVLPQLADLQIGNLVDWNGVAHQAKYFASIHEGVLQPWFEALQVRYTPEQIGFNYIPTAFGQHEVRRWFGANNGWGVAVTVDGIDAMAARIREWVDTNATSVELAKVLIAFDPVLAALTKTMGPAATTMRLTPAWPTTDAELQAAADNFIYSIVPQ
jgi:hypothetical protein